MLKYILGCDPGLSGAFCFYAKDQPLILVDMPTYEITKNKKKKRQLDLYAISNLIDNHSKVVEKAFIEAPSAMPGQGVTSCFNFGFNCGAIQGIVAANFISMQLVHPATWKKALGLTKDKDACRLRASQIMPLEAHNWSLVKNDGRAEAFLIAKYGSEL